jgi:hypothetical protein
MANGFPNRRLDPQTLQRMLLAMYLREMMSQQAPAPKGAAPNRGGIGKTVDTARKVEDLIDKGEKVYNWADRLINGSQVTSEAANAAWNSGADAAYRAQQEAWNAKANAAWDAANPTTTGTEGGIDGAGAAAAALSVLKSGQRFMANPRDEQKAYEASMAAPRAIAAYYTLGGSELAEGFARKQWGGTMKKFDKVMANPLLNPTMAASKLWTSDRWKTEGNRIKRLLEAGVNVPEQFRSRMMQTRGLKKSELVNPKYAADFQGMTADGWVNNKFQNSRNEADMTYNDLAPYAAWAEKRQDWWSLSDSQRRAITNKAQQVGAIREHKGTLDVDWNKVGDVDQLVAQAPKDTQRIQRPGQGQVTRLSAGVYLNDRGQRIAAPTSRQAMTQSYGQNRAGGRR